MDKKSLLVFAIFMLLLVQGAYAASMQFQSVTYDDSTADVGTSRTVSVTMKATSGSVTINTISLSGGLTATSEPAVPFTVTTSGTTKTFVVKSDTSGTYTFDITAVDTGGTSSAMSSDLGSKTLQYVDPSSLTATSVEGPSGSYYNNNSLFGVVVNLQNILTSTQSRNVTLWFSTSTGLTVSGDPQSAVISLPAGTTQKVWNVTVTSSAATGSDTAYVRVGDSSQALSYSFTITTTSSGATTTTGGGSSGSGGSTTTVSTTTTTIRTHEIQTIVKEIVNRNKEELKTLLEQKEELQTGMRLAIGKELAPAIKEAIAATSEKVVRNLNATKTIDVDLAAKTSKIEVKVKYNGTERVKNLIMLDIVPKSFANNSRYITVVAPSGVIINVTKSDPEYLFTFPSFDPNSEKTVSYSVNERVYTGSPEYSAPMFLAESVENVTVGGNATTTTVGGGLLGGSGGLTWIIALAVLVIIGGGVWYYYKNYGKKQPWQISLKR